MSREWEIGSVFAIVVDYGSSNDEIISDLTIIC